MALGGHGVHHQRKAYGVLDILKDTGGLMFMFLNTIAALMLPYQKFAFILSVASQLFQVSAGDISNNPFNKNADFWQKDMFLKSDVINDDEKSVIRGHKRIKLSW